jgi:hypothetical protein
LDDVELEARSSGFADKSFAPHERIDHYNEIEHRRPPNMTETEYVSQLLGKVRRFTQHHGCMFGFGGDCSPGLAYRLGAGAGDFGSGAPFDARSGCA